MSQVVLRRKADRAGQVLTLRMRAFPNLTLAGMGILAVILVLTCFDPSARTQLLSTIALTAGIAAACKIADYSRSRRVHTRP